MRTIKFSKTECGVEVVLRVGLVEELKEAYLDTGVYKTDYFEILFFKKAAGHLVLNQNRLSIAGNKLVFISPYQKRQWQLHPERLDFTFLIFQEDFIHSFLPISAAPTACCICTSTTTRYPCRLLTVVPEMASLTPERSA